MIALGMTKNQFKESYREKRIKNNNIGWQLKQVLDGKKVAHDNSHIWELRNKIGNEIAPEIVRRQKLWYRYESDSVI